MPRRLLRLFFASLALFTGALRAQEPPHVAVIEDAPWSPGDASREGAGELAVLLRLAVIQRDHVRVGLVGVGDAYGRFQVGTQRGLEFASARGVPVVRLARERAPANPSGDDAFIAGGNLRPEEAQLLLQQCLDRLGPLPAEHAARRVVLQQYRAAFRAAQTAAVARN